MSAMKILFVCLGNICRSPTAEGMFTKLVNDEKLDDRFQIDSAGTHAYHVGKSPDARAQQAALGRGIDISHLRARQVHSSDFEYFDLILVMDNENYANVMQVCPNELAHKVGRFLDYAENFDETEVPDPYYGGKQGFEHVLDLVEDASRGLLAKLTSADNRA
jgi:protein-tyrosine phosphatase